MPLLKDKYRIPNKSLIAQRIYDHFLCSREFVVEKRGRDYLCVPRYIERKLHWAITAKKHKNSWFNNMILARRTDLSIVLFPDL